MHNSQCTIRNAQCRLAAASAAESRALIGCAPAGAERCGIEGSVLFQGKPLADAQVIVRPEAGPGASAATDSGGLFVIPRSDGPMPGKVEILVEKSEAYETVGGDGRKTTEYRSVLPKEVVKPQPFTLTRGVNKIRALSI